MYRKVGGGGGGGGGGVGGSQTQHHNTFLSPSAERAPAMIQSNRSNLYQC